MQKLIQTTFIASALLFAALTSSTAYAKTASEIYEQAAKSTVVVVNFDAQGKQKSMGSGVVMPDGDVVTNCHVVKDASRLTVRVGQTERPATLRYSDWDRDVCALSSSGLNAPAATVGSSKTLKVGAKVYAIGAPKGLELTLSDGLVSSLRTLDGGQYIQTTAAISPGSSGGGLYDDKGALVGLTTFYFAGGQSLNFAVPIDWVKDLPKRNTKTQQSAETTTAWLSKGTELASNKDWSALLAHSLRWIKAQPNSDLAWDGLGFTYSMTKQYPESINAYQQVLRINPESDSAWRGLGNNYAITKQYPEAINAYQQALRINPEHASAWYNLGYIYNEIKQYPEAINAYQQALRINPEHANAWDSLGGVYRKTNQYPEAINAHQQALRISPEHANAWYNLGGAYYLTGDRTKVMEVYKKLRAFDPVRADKFFNHFILPRS
jgi:cytochrome c-type biogenesis protein CcmH/NrfG